MRTSRQLSPVERARPPQPEAPRDLPVATGPSPAPAPAPQLGLPSLEATLCRQLLPGDFAFCAITALLLCIMLASRVLAPAEQPTLAVDLCLTAAALAAQCLAPAAYAAPRVRLPFLLLLRARLVALMPHRVDLLRLMTGHSGGGGAAVAAAGGSVLHRLVGRTAGWLRACLLLFVAVAWLQAILASSVGAPLPPALHLPLLAVTVAGLCWRAPTVCAAYVAENPANAQLTHGLHWLLRQVASLLLLGTRLVLASAAEAASTADLCVDLVWALEASVGLVLPTLVVWRAQLQAARRAAARHPGAASDRQLAGSAYARLCAPTLELADSYGGAAVPTLLAALFGYAAALLVRQAGSAAG